MKPVTALFAFTALATMPALANIASLSTDNPAPVVENPDALKAFIGFGGGNALLLKDGTAVLTIRGGVNITSRFRSGIWASTVISDVRDYDAPDVQYVDYKALGILAEYTPWIHKRFSVSVPVLIGCGYVNVQEKGVEDSQAKDGFFISEASLHFNYQVTPTLQASLGGGYRLFLGISDGDLSNSDFSTPFAEVVLSWSEL